MRTSKTLTTITLFVVGLIVLLMPFIHDPLAEVDKLNLKPEVAEAAKRIVAHFEAMILAVTILVLAIGFTVTEVEGNV